MSPFSVVGATPTNAPLTVGDVINQLPPEVVRMGALPAEQPLSLPPALLENALRSGQAALPVFELYRVCPALFQVPISPQDPRLVALPATKLPGLIAQAREGSTGSPAVASAAAPSPFSLGQPTPSSGVPAGSPFQMAQPGSDSMPPQQQPPSGSPFSLGAANPAGSPFSMAQSSATPASAAAPGSPFSLGGSPAGSPFSLSQPAASSPPPGPAAGSPFSQGGSPAGSPFSLSQPASSSPAPSGAPPSPFALGGGPVGSPFSMPQQSAAPEPAAAPGSPFSMGAGPAGSPFSMPQQSAAPEPAAAPGSPFAMGAGPVGSPFSMPQQAAAPEPAAAPGSPFSMGASPVGSPFSMPTTAGSPFASAAPGSASPFASAAPAGASPFGSMSQQPAAASPSASPFPAAPPESRPAAAAPAPQPQASISVLFTPQAQQRASTPSDMANAPGMPFASPFVSAMKEAVPPAEAPAPNAFATPAPAPSPAPAVAPAPASGGGGPASGMAKLGFAAVLSGYSLEELGFNPTTLPAWITTSVPASVLNEQISSGNVTLELGLLIDGISDIGFRNTLGNAKRDFKIKVPQNEVFHALTNMSAAPAPAGAPGSAASPFGSPSPAAAPAKLSVQPNPALQQPAQNSQPLFTSPASQPPAAAQTPMFGAALAPFTQGLPAAAPALAPAPSSVFGTAQPSSSPAPFSFSPPPEPAPGPAPTPVPAPMSAFGSPQPAAAPATFGFTPAAPTEAAAPAAASSFFPSAPQAAAAASSKPLQPLSGAFQSFGAPPSTVGGPPSSPLAGSAKPFDPFASSSTGPLTAKAPVESGLSSAQLLGQAPASQPSPSSSIFAPAPEARPAGSLFAPAAEPTPAPAAFQPTPSFAPALEEIPSFSAPVAPEPQPASRGLFSSQALNVPLFAEPAAPPARQEPKPAPTTAPASTGAAPGKMAAVKHSFLGLSPLDTQTDQLLLRALLGTEEKLAAPRVVELLALQHGLSACVCLHGSHVLSHADKSKPDAVEFQRQAPDIARQLRGLAPLIGIEGAETFTLNAGGRLLTFCFPGESIIGVLHDDEPSTGMRDKITLIARELARMLG